MPPPDVKGGQGDGHLGKGQHDEQVRGAQPCDGHGALQQDGQQHHQHESHLGTERVLPALPRLPDQVSGRQEEERANQQVGKRAAVVGEPASVQQHKEAPDLVPQVGRVIQVADAVQLRLADVSEDHLQRAPCLQVVPQDHEGAGQEPCGSEKAIAQLQGTGQVADPRQPLDKGEGTSSRPLHTVG